jgi:heme/copper-type cytochrome/quinol oxidase subunit 2
VNKSDEIAILTAALLVVAVVVALRYRKGRGEREPTTRPYLLVVLPTILGMIAIACVAGIDLENMADTLHTDAAPFPTSAPVLTLTNPAQYDPSDQEFDTSAQPSEGLSGAKQANLDVQIVALNVAERSAVVDLTFGLSPWIVQHIHEIVLHNAEGVVTGAFPPLSASPPSSWQPLDISIRMLPCGGSTQDQLQCAQLSTISVPLSRLIAPRGNSLATQGLSLGQVSLPISGNPSRFPSDRYELTLFPVVMLPTTLFLLFRPSDATITGTKRIAIPTAIHLAVSASFADRKVTVAESDRLPFSVNVEVQRSWLDKVLIYVMATLPLVVFGVFLYVVHGRRRRNQQVLETDVVVGIVGTMLAILPLRAVLVPSDLGSDNLTLVDNMLILGVLLAGVVIVYANAPSQHATTTGQDSTYEPSPSVAETSNVAPHSSTDTDRTEEVSSERPSIVQRDPN